MNGIICLSQEPTKGISFARFKKTLLFDRSVKKCTIRTFGKDHIRLKINDRLVFDSPSAFCSSDPELYVFDSPLQEGSCRLFFDVLVYGSLPVFWLKAELIFEDGSTSEIETGEDWQGGFDPVFPEIGKINYNVEQPAYSDALLFSEQTLPLKQSVCVPSYRFLRPLNGDSMTVSPHETVKQSYQFDTDTEAYLGFYAYCAWFETASMSVSVNGQLLDEISVGSWCPYRSLVPVSSKEIEIEVTNPNDKIVRIGDIGFWIPEK